MGQGVQCDVCKHDDMPGHVVSSKLGAMSLYYCEVCIALGAEPDWGIEATIETCGGMQNVHPELGLVTFDYTEDMYLDRNTGHHFAIPFKDGTKYETRSEAVLNSKRGSGMSNAAGTPDPDAAVLNIKRFRGIEKEWENGETQLC